MEQKRYPFIHNHSKVFDLINPFKQRPINQINELNGPHIAAEGYQFAFTSLKIKFIAVTALAQTVQIPLKQLAISDACYGNTKF
jgi:hypothetical protein